MGKLPWKKRFKQRRGGLTSRAPDPKQHVVGPTTRMRRESDLPPGSAFYQFLRRINEAEARLTVFHHLEVHSQNQYGADGSQTQDRRSKE
jgi:hypothetical protein